MTDADPARVVVSEEQAWEEVSAYVRGIGMVAHAWNSLHEALCALFVLIIRGREAAAVEAVWHSSYNDRTQREMLRYAITASQHMHPKYKDDLLSVLKRLDSLSAMRDDAIHAPVLAIPQTGELEVVASFLTDHRRAKHLRGKSLIVEFDLCKRWTESVTQFVNLAVDALAGRGTWPDIPTPPTRRQKQQVLGRRSAPKRPSPPRASSQE